MKKARKLWVAAVAMITAVLMIGCGNALTGVNYSTGQEGVKVELTGVITNYSDYVSEDASGSVRTILPAASAMEDYVWWLVYNEINSTTKTYVKISDGVSTTVLAGYQGNGSSKSTDNATFEKLENGKFSITLLPKQYQLVLYAVPNVSATDLGYYSTPDKLLTNAALKASSYIDLTNDSGTANFTMSANNLEGAGSAKFDVVLKGWENKPKGKVVLEVRDFLTNEAVKDSSNADSKVEVMTSGTGVTLWTAGEATNYGTDSFYVKYEKKFKSGIYNFFVTFYDDASGTNKLFSWSDVMIVLPNREITDPIYIADSNPRKPEPPLYFMASYKADSLNSTENDYEVYFEWDDDSNIEDCFVVEILNIDDSAASDSSHIYAGLTDDFKNGNLSDDEWDAYVALYQDAESIIFDPRENPVENYSYYYDGGLWANNQEMTITLPMGHRYLARIKAVNTAGDSEYVYVDLAAYGVEDATGTRVVYTETPNAGVTNRKPKFANFDSDTINIYKIVYHLNGGRWSTTIDAVANVYDSSKYKTDDLVVYNIQDKIAISTTRVPEALPYWDGYHEWKDPAGNVMKSKSTSFGGELATTVMGDEWTGFDTDGNLKYEAYDAGAGTGDKQFGLGSLQMVMDTENFEKGKADVAAFLYWVDDPTKAPTADNIRAKVGEYPITDGYSGFENVELWAKYQPINDPKPEIAGYVSYDDPVLYDLYNEWITLDQGSTSTHTAFDKAIEDIVTAPHITISKGNGVHLAFRLTVPTVKYANTKAWTDVLHSDSKYKKTNGWVQNATGDGTVGGAFTVEDEDLVSPSDYSQLDTADQADYTEMNYVYGLPKGKFYDSVNAIAYRSNGYEAGWASAPDLTSAAAGTPVNFSDIDISSWNKGQTYRIVFTATYKKYTYRTSVNVTITD